MAARIALALGLAAPCAWAQAPDYRGPTGPAVEVDLSVLDSLDRRPAPTPPSPPGRAPVEPRPSPVAAPPAFRLAAPPAATVPAPLPPPGEDGLKRMQGAINAWALGFTGEAAVATPPRQPPAPVARPSPGVSAPPPALVTPARRAASTPARETVIAAPPPPAVALVPPPAPEPAPPFEAVRPASPPAAETAPPPPEPTPPSEIAHQASPPAAETAPSPPVPAPPPPATAAAEPVPATPQIAARPPAALPSGTLLRVDFDAGSSDIAGAVKPRLDGIAARMESDPDLRIQLRAFAEGTKEDANQARRLSLIRALAVRSYLIKQGVRSTRMDVRALGTGYGDGPADRVDVVLAER